MSFGPASRVPMIQITYWAPGSVGSDNVQGFAAPVAMLGRWTESRAEVQDARGEVIVSKTQVIVDRDLEDGGYLAKGTHTDVDPTSVEGAEEIQAFTSTPDLRNVEQLRRAYL